MTRLVWGASSHVGRVREVNEDAVYGSDDLVAVADGMGGHRGGKVASATAIETIEQSGEEFEVADDYAVLVQSANIAVLERAAGDPELQGMGTTMVALGIFRSAPADDGDDAPEPVERLVIANVGDSRGYSLRDGELVQITEDHSLVETLVREGRITREEAEHHPNRNVVTRALGVEPEVLVDLWEFTPTPGDRYLLCSDGLFNEVADNQIASTLRRLSDPEEAAAELVRLANEAGGRDNVSVVVADVVADDDPAGTAVSSADREAGADEPIAAWADEGDHVEASERRGPRFTWRTALFGLMLLAVAVGGVAAIGSYARGAYYVGVGDGDEVTIYKGRPGGVLWFDATVERRTGLDLEELDEAARSDVEAERELDSLDEALSLVESITP